MRTNPQPSAASHACAAGVDALIEAHKIDLRSTGSSKCDGAPTPSSQS